MEKNYELVKDMRVAMNDGMNFQDYVKEYCGDVGIERLKKAWNRANSVRDDAPWMKMLCDNLAAAFKQFGEAMDDLIEEGVSENEIASLLGLSTGSVKEMATVE